MQMNSRKNELARSITWVCMCEERQLTYRFLNHNNLFPRQLFILSKYRWSNSYRGNVYSTKEEVSVVQLIKYGELEESDWQSYIQNHTAEMCNKYCKMCNY